LLELVASTLGQRPHRGEVSRRYPKIAARNLLNVASRHVHPARLAQGTDNRHGLRN
jgi:hypothetical protein